MMKHIKLNLLLLALVMAATAVWALTPERYLHVRVTNPSTHELVRVNLPLSLAEKVIPAINEGELRDGKVQIGDFKADNVNIKMILDAVKTAPDGEFVTVEEKDNNVRVAKEHGQLVVHVIDKQGKQNVDVTIPWEVAQALTANTDRDQINVEAAIKALESVGDTTLVTVTGRDENVRIWIDSNNSDK